MLMARYIKLSLILIALFSIAVVSPSCKRNKKCDVVITVINGNNSTPVYGAEVHLHIPNTTGGNLAQQEQKGTTDASGSVSFTFKLPAILQADVTPLPSSGLNPGTAMVKLEEGKQVTREITLY